MFDRERSFIEFFNPDGLFCALAFGTMSVTATVVAIADFTTMVAGFLMATQCGSTALQNIVQYLCLLGR
jgi:hypothetical protein